MVAACLTVKALCSIPTTKKGEEGLPRISLKDGKVTGDNNLCEAHEITSRQLCLKPKEALPTGPTHIITSPPKLAKFCLGPAQLCLKVQDFALGYSFLGERLFLGLLHLHTKYRGRAS